MKILKILVDNTDDATLKFPKNIFKLIETKKDYDDKVKLEHNAIILDMLSMLKGASEENAKNI